jgi:hypothetical protein
MGLEVPPLLGILGREVGRVHGSCHNPEPSGGISKHSR